MFVLRKKGSKTKKRMKEEEVEKGDCGSPTRKSLFLKSQTKKTFRVGGPRSPFSISFSFILFFVLLPFLLNTKMNTVIVCCVSIQEKVRRSPKGFVRKGNERERGGRGGGGSRVTRDELENELAGGEAGVTDELKSTRLALKLAP